MHLQHPAPISALRTVIASFVRSAHIVCEMNDATPNSPFVGSPNTSCGLLYISCTVRCHCGFSTTEPNMKLFRATTPGTSTDDIHKASLKNVRSCKKFLDLVGRVIKDTDGPM